MDISKLSRDPSKVVASLEELPDGRLVTKTGCKIIIPKSFEEKKMATIGIDNFIVGIYAMVVDDAVYAVSMVNAMIEIDPTSTQVIKINGVDHYEFTFIKGSTVIKTLNLVKTDTIVYQIYDELFSKGHIPWYLSYNDLALIFDTAKEHAGANIGQNQEVTELIVSIVARDKKDKTQYFRSTVQSVADMRVKKPTYIALRNVVYAPTNTLNRLGGSYMATQGVTAALNNPSDRVERMESILRA